MQHPPKAVFEILPLEDNVQRTMGKLTDYERMGIRHIWLIDPDLNATYRFPGGLLHPSSRFGGEEPMGFDFSEVVRLIQ